MKKKLKVIEKALVKAFENSPHKVIHDPEVEGGTLFVLSVNYKKLIKSVMPIIEKYLRG